MKARCISIVTLCGLAMMLAACVMSMDSQNPTEYLDAKTAVTVTAVSKPLVFAHERREIAAHSRDYVTLAAVSVNHSGSIDYYILAYLWSTVDARYKRLLSPAEHETILTIEADDRQLQPQLSGHSAEQAGLGSAIHAPPHHGWTLNLYKTDLETLRFLSQARALTVSVRAADDATAYELWADERPALRGLVGRLEGRN